MLTTRISRTDSGTVNYLSVALLVRVCLLVGSVVVVKGTISHHVGPHCDIFDVHLARQKTLVVLRIHFHFIVLKHSLIKPLYQILNIPDKFISEVSTDPIKVVGNIENRRKMEKYTTTCSSSMCSWHAMIKLWSCCYVDDKSEGNLEVKPHHKRPIGIIK